MCNSCLLGERNNVINASVAFRMRQYVCVVDGSSRKRDKQYWNIVI